MADNERAKRGNEVREKLFKTRPAPSETFARLNEVTVEHLFGDIWTRPGLALRDRSLITCAVLTALGKEPQLKVHLKGALNIGISREEILEMMVHLAHYSGWPTAVNGTRVAEAVFKEVDEAGG
jgi:4-carboxymuconolactone decarboxylase